MASQMFTVALLVALVFAGCVSPDEEAAPPAPTEPEDPQGQAPVAAEDKTTTSGASPEPAMTSTGAMTSNDTNASAAPPVRVPVQHEGSLGPAVTVCPILICVGQDPASDRIFVQELPGALVDYDLTLTWTAGVGSETLRLGIGVYREGESEYDFVEGPSPLVLKGAALTMQPGDEVRVWVWSPSRTPAPLASYVVPEQAFTIEGSLTARSA